MNIKSLLFTLTLLLCSFFALTIQAQSGKVLSLKIKATDRSYLLYIPAAYNGHTPWPLVLNFHALTGSAQSQMDISRMNGVADREHFLIVYPEGLPVGSYNSGWNIPGNSITGTQDDLQFTSDIIDDIYANYNLDISKVYATGWSIGGEMSFYLACAMSDRIAAVASVSGLMLDATISQCSPDRPVSMLQIYGTDDNVDPYNEKAPQFWSNYNNCDQDVLVTELPDIDPNDNSTVTFFDYQNCDENTQVHFYRVNGGGHAWPGSFSMSTLNQDINAHEVVWSFFQANPHPNPKEPEIITGTDKIIDGMVKVYPNPFYDSITITYEVKENAMIRIAIYDVTGKKLSVLVNKLHHPALYTVIWDGTDESGIKLNPGTYFCTVNIGSQSFSSKIIFNSPSD